MIGGLVLLLPVLAFAGRFGRSIGWLSVLMLGLYVVQYNHRALAALMEVPALAAIHAVNALFLFLLAVTLARRAWRVVRDAA
jgi:uncharacterized membrane protein YhaH (DUF805 family)